MHLSKGDYGVAALNLNAPPVAFRRYCFGATPKTRLKAFLSNDSRQKHKKLARQKKKGEQNLPAVLPAVDLSSRDYQRLTGPGGTSKELQYLLLKRLAEPGQP